MMRFPQNRWLLAPGLGLAVLVASSLVPAQVSSGQDGSQFFESRIRPVLVAKCLSCHTGAKARGGLDLSTEAGFKKGAASGPVVTGNDPTKSSLIAAIQQSSDIKMPPDGTKLSDKEIADFEEWVQTGAPWPKDATKTNEKPLWSIQTVVSPKIPKVKLAAWVANPLDSFVLAKLEAAGLKPAPDAEKRALIRRLTYDLTGLPPTPEEVAAYLTDKYPTAYEKVVDRLLASPHYGERMARHWMDIARYADTKGYVFMEDRVYPNAYTYRDWLINAFNRDLPYDRFIVDQLAADLRPEPDDPEQKNLAAMGFLTLGRRFLNSQPDIIDDRLDVTIRGLQGVTIGCARCHDHKFDPIPTADYYSLYAVFDSSVDHQAPIGPAAVRDAWAKHQAALDRANGRFNLLVGEEIKALREEVKREPNALNGEVKGALQRLGVGALPDPAELSKLETAFSRDGEKQLAAVRTEIKSLEDNTPTKPELAMALADGPNPHDGVIFKRGSPGNPGARVDRHYLSMLPLAAKDHWTQGSGRLQLAEAITSNSNPLTARVLVNRVWQDLFGAGIVRTASDFGHQGDPPTDPKLLDYLATRFMAGGWSIKKLQKLIVTSHTYRQSCLAPAKTAQLDPDNRRWGHMNYRRLDFEEIHDSLLRFSGNLDLASIGGKSVDLWKAPFSNRRALYGFIDRQNLPGIFKTFDFASPDSTSGRRFQTTVPQQALFFMNSPFCQAQASALAAKVGAIDPKAQVTALYRTLFQRRPDADELQAGVVYLKDNGAARLALYAQALMMTNEFIFVD